MKNSHQVENVNYLLAMSTQPQASGVYNPCDNTLSDIIRRVRDSAAPIPHLAFRHFCLLGDLGFSGHEPPHLLTLVLQQNFLFQL